MDSEHRRKRKHTGRPFLQTRQYFSLRTLFLCLSFFVFLLFLSSNRFSIGTSSFRPVINASTLSLLYSSASNSVLDSFNHKLRPSLVEDRVIFPDLALLMVSNKIQKTEQLECVFYKFLNNSNEVADVQVQSVHSVDKYNEFRSIVRCPIPQTNCSAATVDLRPCGEVGGRNRHLPINQTGHSWDRVAYEAILDGDTVVVFAKGLNLRPHRISDPTRFLCHFGLKNLDKNGGFLLTTKAVSVAQEVVRCLLPRSIRGNPKKAWGIRITVSHLKGNTRRPVRTLMPSVARVHNSNPEAQKRNRKNKYELCVCTMVWNQASALKEWIMYHAWLGVEKWFIYDNNSDDDIKRVIRDLDIQGYNVSRQTWPWIKTQEAGFSHCALRARDECNWVGFFDVDEFFYFPNDFHSQLGPRLPGENSLKSMVANLSSSTRIGEIRTACHSFGPSGLKSPPKKGVIVGYTCRLQGSERHKSIVRPDLLDSSLLNVVHHFQLRKGYKYLNMPEATAIINHYKYQVWETFKAKFYRRVATYVVDWQEDQNKGSKDRAPGLGTEAIEPPNWRLQFCEVWDTGLKDFLLSYFADATTGMLPWERSSL